MTLRVFHGPRLGPLADELVAALAEPLADPFIPEVVAVPTAGVRDWLRRHLARSRGVTANVDFPFPNRFTSMALGLDPARADADDPWSVARLTWALVAVLDHGGVSVPGWSAATPSARPRQYVVARHVADLFDQYATNRPDVLAQWAAGVRGDGTVSADRDLVGALDASMAWQFELFRAVRERIGEPHPAEDRGQRLAALRAGQLVPAVPERAALFGTSALSAAQLGVLDALGTVRDVDVFVVSPSPGSWERSPPIDPRHLVARRRDADDDALGGHPLVRSWGRSVLETAGLVRGLGAAVVVGPQSADLPAPTTLLRHLQGDIAEDRPPTPFGGAADGTVQVHACHGALRQLDALRDALDACFVADPTLEPRDVLVMTPDVGRFAPFAPAVLGRGRLPVPLTVSDLTLGAENPVAVAFRAVVAALAGRCTAVDVLDLATLPPIRRMFSLTPADLERFGRWVDQLGTSWGLDAHQRDEWLEANVAEGTWAAGIDRLLLGAAVPAPPGDLAAAYPGGLQPFDDIAADDMRSAGRLAELVGRLRRARSLLAGRHRIDEWTARLTAVLGATCAVAPDEAWQLASVAGAIDAIREQAMVGGAVTDVALDLREVAAVLDGALGTARGRLRTGSGDVLLTGLVPLRNVPARVVCLLGIDSDSMRPATLDGDDLLARRPCVGERDRRAELRHGLLDAVMASSDRVIITCDGVDVATNRPVRPSVALAELLDVVHATVDDDAIVVHHRRRAYDEQLFVADATAPSYDDAMLAAAAARRTAVVTPTWASRFDDPLPLLVPAEVDLERLATACTRPARVLLRDRLDVRVPDDFDRGDVNIALGLPPLRGAELGRDLLARLLERDGADRDAVVARWRSDAAASGRLAPRRLGEESLAAFEAQVLALLSGDAPGTPHRDEVLAAARRVAIDLQIVIDEPAELVDDTVRTVEQVPSLFDTARVAVRLRDEVAGVVGSTVHRLAFSRPHHRYLVRTALDLAALVVTEPEVSWDAVLITRAVSGLKILSKHFTAGGPEQARTLLEVALALRLEALRRRLPLFERASHDAVHSWRPVDEMLLDDDDGAAPAHGDLGDADAAFVWQQLSPAELDGLAIAPGELALELWRAVDGFLAAAPAPQRVAAAPAPQGAP